MCRPTIDWIDLLKPLMAILAAISWVAAAEVTASAATTIAGLHGNTAVQTYGGVQVWSDYDATSGRWRVVVRRGGKIAAPSIPMGRTPTEVAVGPSPSGVPQLAYTSCTSACRVVVSGLDGSDPRTVPGSEGASHPAIWGDRVAWVRGPAMVVTSLRDGSGRRVLGGAPHRKCFPSPTSHRRTCEAPRRPRVEALALYGRQLALIDSFEVGDGVGANGTVTEVRSEPVTGGAQRLVALMDVGEGDEKWVGPSWAAGKLFFYKTSMGAGFAVYGFDPGRNTYVTARASTYLTGFAVTDGGRRAYEAAFPGDPATGITCADVPATRCALQLSDRFIFRPTRSLVRVP